MNFLDFLYNVGGAVETLPTKIRELITPRPSAQPPEFRVLRKFVKKELTVNEFLSLQLQLVFLTYLIVSLFLIIFRAHPTLLALAFILELWAERYTLVRHGHFLLDPEPYRFFYYGISVVSFASFFGYEILRRSTLRIEHYMAYVVLVLVVVLIFRWYFKQRYGREYTYGVIEEVRNDLVKVFVHDDIAANAKPGHYWVEKVPDAEPGRVVKLLLEDRKLRGAVPSRILEVYLESQSSQTSSEPKKASE
ncbi:MAG: DUF2101 family protein [Thermococcus sp.]|nr:DUF2101 family protein [Thermococcus sp.]